MHMSSAHSNNTPNPGCLYPEENAQEGGERSNSHEIIGELNTGDRPQC